MGIGNIFKAFQPKDKVFFVLFEKVAETLTEMSKEFHEGLLDFDINDDTMLTNMSDYEHKLDDLTHEIFVQLGENFITPFDREDISHLASALDDIADFMYASAKYIYLYKTPLDPAYSEFSLLIYKSCLEIQSAMGNLKEFKNAKAVKESCIKINSFENIADDVLSQATVKLFETNDAINIIKIKSVLEYLETVTDKAEDVANIMDSIVIKYA
ncbi:possible phosphate transport regulator [Flavobacteriaceae bacterium 3519-10]|nr:possible phosphate transport regulator [Flavobacteriaceae bacterium 3519-10]